MDVPEQIIARYLESLNLGRVIYVPDGNAQPDLLIDNRIAVQAQR